MGPAVRENDITGARVALSSRQDPRCASDSARSGANGRGLCSRGRARAQPVTAARLPSWAGAAHHRRPPRSSWGRHGRRRSWKRRRRTAPVRRRGGESVEERRMERCPTECTCRARPRSSVAHGPERPGPSGGGRVPSSGRFYRRNRALYRVSGSIRRSIIHPGAPSTGGELLRVDGNSRSSRGLPFPVPLLRCGTWRAALSARASAATCFSEMRDPRVGRGARSRACNRRPWGENRVQ